MQAFNATNDIAREACLFLDHPWCSVRNASIEFHHHEQLNASLVPTLVTDDRDEQCEAALVRLDGAGGYTLHRLTTYLCGWPWAQALGNQLRGRDADLIILKDAYRHEGDIRIRIYPANATAAQQLCDDLNKAVKRLADATTVGRLIGTYQTVADLISYELLGVSAAA